MTGGIGSSNCGGNFGTKLKEAGFDGVILYGKADTPVTVRIIDGRVKVVDSPELWGLNAEELMEQLPKEYGEAGDRNLLEKHLCGMPVLFPVNELAGRCGAGAILMGRRM